MDLNYAIGRIRQSVDVIQTLSRNNQLLELRALIYVAENETRPIGVTVSDIASHLGIPLKHASGIVRDWILPEGDHIPAVLLSDIDPSDRRRRLLSLTRYGKAAIAKAALVDSTVEA